MSAIVLNCPNCRQPYQTSPEMIGKYSGRTITCRKCNLAFEFDAAMDAATRESANAAADSSIPVGEVSPTIETAQSAAAAVPPPPIPVQPPPYMPPVTPPGAAPFAPPASGIRVPATGYPPGIHGRGASLGDAFAFQRMVIPAVLPLVFWIGVLYCLFNGLRLLLGFVLVYSSHLNPYYGEYAASFRLNFNRLPSRVFSISGFYSIVDAFFWLVLGPLFWRGFCELIMAASRLLEGRQR